MVEHPRYELYMHISEWVIPPMQKRVRSVAVRLSEMYREIHKSIFYPEGLIEAMDGLQRQIDCEIVAYFGGYPRYTHIRRSLRDYKNYEWRKRNATCKTTV